MEGPTPVSALIHAATMVTAGVYMVARSHALFERSGAALEVVAWVGAITALFAATIGLVQTDIKRVLAYSTISQLGYMFARGGLGAYVAGIFHLVTHAFFKALLFLGAGSVIHGLDGEQDLRKMGGLARADADHRHHHVDRRPRPGRRPAAGRLLLQGRDPRRRASTSASRRSGRSCLVGAFLTAFYTFRLFFLAFMRRAADVARRCRTTSTSRPGVDDRGPSSCSSLLTVVAGVAVGHPAEAGTPFAQSCLGCGASRASTAG